ncbi:MAG TPA: MFS transporter [Opitutaceae bacterium]|nr:MFS transporter [Opitutaceae bacterium]
MSETAGNPNDTGPRRTSLGVIFLTLYIDLVGFSIFFPLFPSMLDYYLGREGSGGLLGWLLMQVEALTRFSNIESHYTEVLFAGFLGSIYSLLQFVFAPFWGARSDRLGRRNVLLLTVAGTAGSYLVWMFSGSFLLFIVSRLIGGLMSGNLSVATAAVADVTSRENRAKGMGLIGAAFGLGFITGPAIGGFAAGWNILDTFPELAAIGANPFTVPAAVAFVLCAVNFFWIRARFVETRVAGTSGAPVVRERNPLALFRVDSAEIRRVNIVYFLYALCFSGMELTLAFLAVERLDYTVRQLPLVFVFIGVVSILTQGLVVRRLVPSIGEKLTALIGIFLVAVGFVGLAYASGTSGMYWSMAAVAMGSGLSNAALSAIISLYAGQEVQGKMLGIFRSLGSLARTIGPVLAGMTYWWFGSAATYGAVGIVLIVPFMIATTLPPPGK